MTIARRIWSEGESPPPESKHHSTSAPPNWFCEELEYAVELYALEVYLTKTGPFSIHVEDDKGQFHTFRVSVHLNPVVRFEKKVG